MCGTYLFGDDGERVLLIGQEIKDAPHLEGAVLTDTQGTSIQMLLSAKSPAHPIELHLVKVSLYLRNRMGRKKLINLIIEKICRSSWSLHHTAHSIIYKVIQT